jgi:hypothetical protein
MGASGFIFREICVAISVEGKMADYPKVYPEWFKTTIEDLIESGHIVKISGSGGSVSYEVSNKGERDTKKVLEWMYRCK